MASIHSAVMRAWREAPETSGRRSRATSTGSRRGSGCSTRRRRLRALVHGGHHQHLPQRRRPARRRGRADQAAIIYDSPVTGTVRRITYAELKAEVEALAAVLSDLGVGRGDRVILYMPMIPEAVFGMLACARLGAVHSVVFGGFAAHELATRIDDATPKVILSASCGIEGAKTVAYKPLLDARDRAGRASRRDLPDRAAPAARLRSRARPRSRLGEPDGGGPRPAPCPACPWRRPTRPTCSTPPARPASRRASSATPAGIMVALAWTMTAIYGVEPGEVFWAASDVGLGRGPLLHRLRAADRGLHQRSCSRASRSAPPTPAPTGARSSATASPPCSPRRPRSAPSRRRTRTGPSSAGTTSRRCAPCSSRASAPTPIRSAGPRSGSTSRPSTTGGRPRRLGDLRQPRRPRASAGQARLADRAHAGLGPAGSGRRRPSGPGRHARQPRGQAAAAARRLPDAVERGSPLPRRLPRGVPGYYKTADAGLIDADGYAYVMSRTDDIINVAGHGCRRARWRRSCPRIRPSPNAP